MSTLDPQLKIIRVYGTLAKVLKRRTFKAAVHSPKDAIAFLLANFPEVQQYLRPRFFRINIGNRCINEQELDSPTGLIEEIHIIPSVSGAGGPVANIIAGVSLIAASIFVPFLAPILLPLGIGLTLVGIGQLLSPTPGVPDEESNPRNSFNFSGVQQTSREGPPVPLVYGDIITGSIVISAGFDEYDEEIAFGFNKGGGNPNPVDDDELFPQANLDESVIFVENPYGASLMRVWHGEEQFIAYRELCDCNQFGSRDGGRDIYLRLETSPFPVKGVETFTAGLLKTRYKCNPGIFECFSAPCTGLESVYNLEISFIRLNDTKLIAQSNYRDKGDICGSSVLISYGAPSTDNQTFSWIGAIEAQDPATGNWTVVYSNSNPGNPGSPNLIEGETYTPLAYAGDWSGAPVPIPD
jgi:predicted phage tail protein